MIRLRADFFSSALGMGVSAEILLPQPAAGQIGMPVAPAGDGPCPVVYALHGLSDDCTTWARRTAIERYASAAGVAVVMPEVRRSFYADEHLGEAYWTYISEELPRFVQDTFPVSRAREDTFVVGLSMGGYGAFRLALNHPDRFAAAASLSGPLDIAELDPSIFDGHVKERVWPDGKPTPTDDLVHLLRASDPARLPQLFLLCGTEDPLLGMNQGFIALADELGVTMTSTLRPGAHEWNLWDAAIEDVMGWLPIRTPRGPAS